MPGQALDAADHVAHRERQRAFEGGGTYFEHLDKVLDMPQGHATFRPGAVRHAGAAVTSGLRYVVGDGDEAANDVSKARGDSGARMSYRARPERHVPLLHFHYRVKVLEVGASAFKGI